MLPRVQTDTKQLTQVFLAHIHIQLERLIVHLYKLWIELTCDA